MKLDTRDKNGYKPEEELIGTQWDHFRGSRYKIIGFAWCGDDNVWMILHTDSSSQHFVRTVSNFFENHGPGAGFQSGPRFVKVDESKLPKSPFDTPTFHDPA